MIGRLTGVLAEKSPPQLLIDVNGVGYEVDVPMSSFYNLPALGERVTLLTHFVVREDAQILYGFLTHDERATFRLLVKISGVGPRTALSILSGLSVNELAQAGKVVEAAHRHVDLVADTVHVDEQLRGRFFREGAGDASDHPAIIATALRLSA